MQDDTTVNQKNETEPRQGIQSPPPSFRNRGNSFETVRSSYRLALLLALLSTLTLEIATADGEQPVWRVALTLACEAAIVAFLSFFARRMNSPNTSVWKRRPVAQAEKNHDAGLGARLHLIWILCLATAPFMIEIVIRGVTDTMLPLELLLLAYFRNGVLALAIFAHRNDCQRMCCSLSTFLTIFASALASQIWLHGLVVVFSVIGIWWLMGSYWETLRGRLAATSETEPSKRWLLGLPMIVLTVLLGLPVAATQTHALRGFMPSSGGTDWYSESARSGVGDGDALVAGTENIQSFAPIEDAPFLNSHDPSLYDLFDDSYSEPVKVEKQERAISLLPEFAAKQKESHLAESKQAGKEFSTLRKQGETKRKNMSNLESNALLYVKGRVPLHLKLETFDRYDGIDWFPDSLSTNVPKLEIQTLNGKPWLRVSASTLLEIYSPLETHALKIIHLDTNRVPAATQLLGIHIDKVDRSDFFEWAQPGIVRMDRDKLPPLSVIHVQSRVLDERILPKAHVYLSSGPAVYRQFGSDEQSQRVRELAELLTKDIPIGWPQVQTIVERLRRGYVHDHATKPPAECEHTVADFLFESRRGPDYQFASSAVWMLRSLGYTTRLVSGFYANPARYDMRARHTAVTADDVHFWAEVWAGSDNWIPIEPTPGYQLLQPPPTLGEQCLAAGLGAWQWCVANVSAMVVFATTMICFFFQRHFVADLISTAIWRWWPARGERAFVRQTLRLLDRRFHRMGFKRPLGMTSTRWLERTVSCASDSDRQSAHQFKELAEWADFGPAEMSIPLPEYRAVCHKAVLVWSWRTVAQGTVQSWNRSSSRHALFPFNFLQQPVGWLRKIAK